MEAAQHSPTAAAMNRSNRIGDWPNNANCTTAAAAPATVPASRQALFETIAPRTGLATMNTVVTAE